MNEAAEEELPAAELMTLLDMDPEIILEAFEYLSAKSVEMARRTCKLFAILVDEKERTTTYLTGAVGKWGTVLDALAPRLEAAPSMGILFSESDDEQGANLRAMAKKLPYHLELVGGHQAVVAGTDVAGSLALSKRGEDACALQLGRFPEATVKSFCVSSNQPGGWHEQLTAQDAFTAGWKVFLIVSLSHDTEEVVKALQEAHPEAAIIGGFATGNTLYRIRKRRVELVESGVVGLMFRGNVPLAAFVSRGARGLGDGPYSFTADDIKTVQTRGGAQLQLLTHVCPAAADGGSSGDGGSGAGGARQSALQATIDNLNHSGGGGGLMLGVADGPDDGYQLTPLDERMVVQSEAALILPPHTADEPLWERGGAVRFYSFDPDSCRTDLTRRLKALKTDAARKGERLLGAVMFTCGGRGSNFFGEPAFDARTFAEVCHGTPLIGMFAGGEIGPPLYADAPPSKTFQVGGAGLHGFTAIFGMFIVPARQPRASQLAFADDEAIAAAYAEVRSRAPAVPIDDEGASSSGADGSSGATAAGLNLPRSLAELRALPVKALKAAMKSLGIGVVAGSEKEDLVQAIAPHLAGAGEEPLEEAD